MIFALCRGAFYNNLLPLDWFSLLYSINFMVVQVEVYILLCCYLDD